MKACTVKFHRKQKSRNAAMVIGLPGVGLVGRLAAEYLATSFKGVHVASLYSDAFPPNIISTPDSTVHVIRNEVFKISAGKGKKSRDVYVLVGDAQPSLPPQGFYNAQHAFSEDLVELAKKLGCSKIYTIAGLPSQERVKQGAKVSALATTKDAFKGLKGSYSKTGPGLPVNGAAGLALQYAMMGGLDGACLISTTSPELVYPDFGAAAAILKVLDSSLSLGLDVKALDKKSKEFEAQLKKALKSQEFVPKAQQSEIPRGYEFPKEHAKNDGRFPSYIR